MHALILPVPEALCSTYMYASIGHKVLWWRLDGLIPSAVILFTVSYFRFICFLFAASFYRRKCCFMLSLHVSKPCSRSPSRAVFFDCWRMSIFYQAIASPVYYSQPWLSHQLLILPSQKPLNFVLVWIYVTRVASHLSYHKLPCRVLSGSWK